MKLIARNVFFLCLFLAGAYTVKAEDGKSEKYFKGYYANQQTPLQEYKGTLVDVGNKPVPGVRIRVTGNDVGTKSDNSGNFSISANPGDTLFFSHASYKDAQLIVGTSTAISVTLERENSAIDIEAARPVELIYTRVPSHQTTASHDEVFTPDIIKSPVTSFRNAITGRLAGLYTFQGSGLPGADGASFTLRGQAPVIIIDGVVANLTTFDLEEIESVTVLKDAIGTGMLGVRGSGGAVVVTTKKGKVNKQQISFTVQKAVQQPLGLPKTLGAYDYAKLYNEALTNDGLAPVYTDADLQGYQANNDPYKYPNVDWRDLITNKTSAFNRYTFNATGGSQFARYFVALEHVNQAGFFKTVDSNVYNTNNNFKSYVIRSNIDVSITPKLTGGIHLLGRILDW